MIPERQALKHRSFKPSKLKYYAFDLETRKDGSLIEGAIGDLEVQTFFQTIEELIGYMFQLTGKKVIFLAHWADGMEFPHIIQCIRNSSQLREQYDLDPLLSGDRMVQLKIVSRETKKVVIIRDTYALSGTSLAKWARVFGGTYQKSKTIDFDAKEYDPQTDRDYLARDVQLPVACMVNFSQMIYETFQSVPGITAASTAMKAFQASIPHNFIYFRINDLAEDFMRKGYFGGYCHPGHDNHIHRNVVSRDMTGAYGARMKLKFPTGNPTLTTTFREDKQGMWYVEAVCIDADLPIVPYRDQHGLLHWLGQPGDYCHTYCTTEEVLYFRMHGYQINVLEGYYFDRSEYVFRDFIEKCEELEQRGGVYKEIAKEIRNHLYGKFGTRKYVDRVVITDDPKDGYEQMYDVKGRPFDDLFTVREEVDAEYIQPHWAAYVTAYQRLALFDMIFEIGVENCLGADTDSVKMEEKIDEQHTWTSEEYYGSTHIEAEFDEYRSEGPKHYVGVRKRKHILKVKGIPAKYVTQSEIFRHLHRRKGKPLPRITYPSNTKALTMLKSNGTLPLVVERSRTLSTLHSETWEVDNNGLFHVKRNPDTLNRKDVA